MTPVDILRAAKAVIDTPEKWTKGSDARDLDGDRVAAKGLKAVCWCIVGSLKVAAPSLPSQYQAEDLVANASGILVIEDFNDAPTTTHADVMNLFERAIAAAEGETR